MALELSSLFENYSKTSFDDDSFQNSYNQELLLNIAELLLNFCNVS